MEKNCFLNHYQPVPHILLLHRTELDITMGASFVYNMFFAIDPPIVLSSLRNKCFVRRELIAFDTLFRRCSRFRVKTPFTEFACMCIRCVLMSGAFSECVPHLMAFYAVT